MNTATTKNSVMTQCAQPPLTTLVFDFCRMAIVQIARSGNRQCPQESKSIESMWIEQFTQDNKGSMGLRTPRVMKQKFRVLVSCLSAVVLHRES